MSLEVGDLVTFRGTGIRLKRPKRYDHPFSELKPSLSHGIIINVRYAPMLDMHLYDVFFGKMYLNLPSVQIQKFH
jgi:hypothetical protein